MTPRDRAKSILRGTFLTVAILIAIAFEVMPADTDPRIQRLVFAAVIVVFVVANLVDPVAIRLRRLQARRQNRTETGRPMEALEDTPSTRAQPQSMPRRLLAPLVVATVVCVALGFTAWLVIGAFSGSLSVGTCLTEVGQTIDCSDASATYVLTKEVSDPDLCGDGGGVQDDITKRWYCVAFYSGTRSP